MKRCAISLLTMIGMPIAAQPVAESIHRPGKGAPEVCGFKAATVADLESRIKVRSGTQTLPGTDEYRAYATADKLVLTFTSAVNRAHPAVACRFAFTDREGGTSLKTEISCFNTRENCDWLYREFEALNRKATDEAGRK